MEFNEAKMKFNEIFRPGLIEEGLAVEKKQKRFVYYTSSETAMKVLRNQELWFRNAKVMNDFSEISYGLELIRTVFSGSEGKRFRDAVESVFPGTIQQAEELLSSWASDWQFETYIACVSIHNPNEDNSGRLSMWRAYGNVALVINNTPMTAITDQLGVFSIPVLYLSNKELNALLSQITDAILKNSIYLQEKGQKELVAYIHNMLFRFAIATKHPGFKEEKEWRLYYRPSESNSPCMTAETVVLSGVPQKIYKLRLAHEPQNGLFHADIPSLLNRVIIGPTEFPYISYKAFVDVLSDLSVENSGKKVIISDIPLRVR